MAARVREELTSLRRWLLLPLPRSSCCRWLSRQSLMSQPWAGLLWKLCVLCRCWWWLYWKQSLFVRESGLTLEPGYLLVITTKAINFLLYSCPGRESQNWSVLLAEVVVQGGILFCSVFLLDCCIMSTTIHDSSLCMIIFMSYLAIILVYDYIFEHVEWQWTQLGFNADGPQHSRFLLELKKK